VGGYEKMVNTHKLEHSDTVITNIHSKDNCLGEFCTIHNMSDHILRPFPQHWREDRSIMERICDHGVGHPDPDSPWPDGDYRWIHGCCGCCSGLGSVDCNVSDPKSLIRDPTDLLQELRDFAYIIDETKGSAVVTMLEGKIFNDAADEIERITEESNRWQASAAGLSQDISNAEDQIEQLRSMGDMMVNSINYLLGENQATEDLLELLTAWKDNHHD
jgi:hypothetical protein